MPSGKQYRTKQKSLILSAIRAMGEGHFTAQEISEKMKEGGNAVGLTTVYRLLDRMVEGGEVRKYVHSSTSPACYEWIGSPTENEECQRHYHLKCKCCQRLFHVKCHQIDHFTEHILFEHGFSIDHATTVFLGVCEHCRANGKNAE